MRKIWNRLVALFAPVWSISLSLTRIANSLAIIQELYETELSSRHPPIWRITERPGPSDTEVLYSSDPVKRRHPFDSEEDADEEEKN